MAYEIGVYDPCPCGSGKKYKFCCAAAAKANRHGKFPIGTIAHYGPDDKTTTKIAAGVILREDADVILERFVGTDVVRDQSVAEQIKKFFARHGVKSVVVTDGNIGCPHEEGMDFPRGADCPFCPFWAGKQGTARRAGDNKPTIEILDPADAPPKRDWDAAFARMDAVVGDHGQGFDQSIQRVFAHLKANLQLPCEVTGSEDFRWEEPYVIGGWSQAEYRKLKKTQPSHTDRFELLWIERDGDSRWMMFHEDIRARVKRVSDGRLFTLGLAELEATDKTSPNHQLLDDYAVWFVNNR